MAKFARIDGGFVVETLVSDSLPDFHPDLVWVSCPDVVEEGYAYDGNTFTSPEDQKSINDIKEDKIQSLNALIEEKYNNGFSYTLNGSTNIFQINLEAQKDMLAVQSQFFIEAGAATPTTLFSPHGGFWRDIDNNSVSMDNDEVKDFFQSAFNHVFLIKSTSWFHEEQVNALNAKQDILDYDIEAGWP